MDPSDQQEYHQPPTTTTRTSPVTDSGDSSSSTDYSSIAHPLGLTDSEFDSLRPTIATYHRYKVGPGRCSSLLSQRVRAPAGAVWSILRRFERPQIYKHFIRSCQLKDGPGSEVKVGCLREVCVISGLPGSTSTERLDILDEHNLVVGFTIIGGEHRLRNYKSVTTVKEFTDNGGCEVWSIVLESYAVDVPEGNTEEDTTLFADTVIRLNLQKLASVAESIAASSSPLPPLDDSNK